MSFSFLFPVLEELEYSWPFAQAEMMLREVRGRDRDHHYHSRAKNGDPWVLLCFQ